MYIKVSSITTKYKNKIIKTKEIPMIFQQTDIMLYTYYLYHVCIAAVMSGVPNAIRRTIMHTRQQCVDAGMYYMMGNICNP